jgi:hypothetical protein
MQMCAVVCMQCGVAAEGVLDKAVLGAAAAVGQALAAGCRSVYASSLWLCGAGKRVEV